MSTSTSTVIKQKKKTRQAGRIDRYQCGVLRMKTNSTNNQKSHHPTSILQPVHIEHVFIDKMQWLQLKYDKLKMNVDELAPNICTVT